MGTENLDRSEIGTIEINDGTGWQNLGIISEEIVRINGEDINHFDISGHPHGVNRTVFDNVDVEIEFIWEEVANPDLWALILHGASITTTTAGTQTVVNENVIMMTSDWVALAHAADFIFNSPVTVNDPDASVTYIEGEDYYLDRKGGHLKRISDGAIGEGRTVHVSYSYRIYTGKSFRVFGNPAPVDCTMRLTKPLLNGNRLRIIHDKVIFVPRMEFPLKPGERGSWAGVSSRIRFLRSTGDTCGAFGLWEIYTP